MTITHIEAPLELTLRRLVETLPRFTYRFTSEIDLHTAMAEVLTAEGFDFRREVVAGTADRFDFLVSDRIVIEAKVKGSMTPALLQCKRYAARDDVDAVVLVTTRFWGQARMGDLSFHNKPTRVVKLRGASF